MKRITLLIILVSQLGFSQNFTEYGTGNVVGIDVTPDFGICLMGGATEHDEAMRWFLRKANGGDILVLRASGSDGYNDYFYSELGVAVNSVTTFVINNEAGALDPYVLNKVANAEAIWFAGGDQYNYVSYFKDNAMEDAINHFVNVKQGVIGGTSAGMAILGSAYFSAQNGTVTNAQALSNPYHSRMTLGYNDFLDIPYLEHITTDSHYDDPDRKGRHSTFLARYIQDNGLRAFGIACNEYTAVCVDSDGKGYVYGDYPNYEEHAYFLQANCVEDFEPENCTNGSPLNWNRSGEAIKVCKVPGTNTGENYFDLSDWMTESGGEWFNWSIDNGSFNTSITVNPECDLLSVSDFDEASVSVFPNPFIDTIHIASDALVEGVILYDVTGKSIQITNTIEGIDTSLFASGVYFLKLKIDNKTQTFKLVKK
ncbi:T9SS type A sorting domain-containing protein [Lacinutrix iliipiscaria]|uniref:T9SS type A sorting domain-containing protein n=1 Tax=Lacinutrix iliipiscaria TaxID=1230532 RepID=A0ABW5WNL2_9FLAO